jgi:hypothetical protein
MLRSILRAILHFYFLDLLLKIRPLLSETLRKTKEVFGAQEESAGGALGPAQAQCLAQATLRGEGRVARDIRAADGGKASGRRNPLEQRRFPGAVFAHKKRDHARDIE